MPVHDWTRVRSNRFHHFRQTWTPLIAAALNDGVLPKDFLALVEQKSSGLEPDVVAVALPDRREDFFGGLALAEAPTQVRVRTSSEAAAYVCRPSAA